MIGLPTHTRVYLALGATDMRKEINWPSMPSRGTCLSFATGGVRL